MIAPSALQPRTALHGVTALSWGLCVACALTSAFVHAAPGPPPVAGAPPTTYAEASRPAVATPAVKALAPPLRCEEGATQGPAETLACFERAPRDDGAERLETHARLLEHAGLIHEAGLAWRRLTRVATGTRGLEAGRRANALAELEAAREHVALGHWRAARAPLRSMLQTFSRQRRQAGLISGDGVRLAAAQTAAACRERRIARQLTAAGAWSGGGPWRSRWFKARSQAVSAAPGVERCLGGRGADRVNHAVYLKDAGALLVGEVDTAAGDRQGRLWRVDRSGSVVKQADFGAEGPDRFDAVVQVAPQGWLAIGTTWNSAGHHDLWAVRADINLRLARPKVYDLHGDDRVVGAVATGQKRAWVLSNSYTGSIPKVMLTSLNAQGDLLSSDEVPHAGGQAGETIVKHGEDIWVAGGDARRGLLVAYEPRTRGPRELSDKVPGKVLGLMSASATLRLVGQTADNQIWVAKLLRGGRFKRTRAPRLTLEQGDTVGLWSAGRKSGLWVSSVRQDRRSWVAEMDRRGRLRRRVTMPEGLRLRGVISRGKKTRLLFGDVRGCGRDVMDGWLRVE